MRYGKLLHYLSIVLQLEAAFMLLPLCVSLYCGEWNVVQGFAVTIAGMAIVSLFGIAYRRSQGRVTIREGFITVAASWILLSLCGALPYWISGEIGSFADCLFESVSGFTTTAASVVTDVETLSKGLQLWRSLSLWIGGMGVLVFLLAAMPFLSVSQSFPAIKSESPVLAPGKPVPKLQHSAMILFGIYLGLTAFEIILLSVGKMSLFESILTAMATAGTGGFSVRNTSIGGYGDLYIEIVVGIFMFLCGINYNLLYYLVIRDFSSVFRNDEWKSYINILVVSSGLIALNLISNSIYHPLHALRASIFQTVSISTTTGFTTADISFWPQFSKTILFLLMFVGACTGSSGGGLKVARVVVLFREAKRVLYRMLHPRSVSVVKLDGKQLDATSVHGVTNYFLLYISIYLLSLVVISLDSHLDFETIFTAAAACINNVGAGMGLVSVTGQYASFSTFSKIVLSIDMLLGRLEIYPLLLMLAPRMWRKV